MIRMLFFGAMAIFLLSACDPSAPVPAEDMSGYELEAIPGQATQLARLLDDAGRLVEQGLVEDGQKTGTWVEYDPANGVPVKVISYSRGMYNGAYLELSNRGQLQLKAHYRNNKLHGPWTKYRFGGRIEAEATYVNGQLDGLFREYYPRENQVKQEITYEMGVKDGPFRYYNEEGEVTLEYTYRDGEKMSGGIKNE